MMLQDIVLAQPESQSLLNEVKFPTEKVAEFVKNEKKSQSLLNEVKFPTAGHMSCGLSGKCCRNPF
jgi:hypothetical protein